MFLALFFLDSRHEHFPSAAFKRHHTTLASIIGVHKGFRQPSFKGAVGHEMTEILTGKLELSWCY
jgi:hypothetical protein